MEALLIIRVIKLAELLHSDTRVEDKNKKALFIDCLGQGKKEPYINDTKIGLLSLFETASLYTVQTRYMTFDKDVENTFERYKIPVKNYQIIGFTTIRNHLQKMKKDEKYEELVSELKNTTDDSSGWFKLYTDFKNDIVEKFGESAFKKNKDGEIIAATLQKDKFQELSAGEVLLMYEYASHIETKLRIKPEERDILLLAGRYAVFLKTPELKELLVEYK